MTRSVDLKYGSRELEKMGARALAAAGRGLYSAAVRGVSVIVTQLIPAALPTPVDRGLYRAGWRAGPLRGGDRIVGGEIWNVEHMAAIVERGARAENIKIGRAMIDALTEWVKRKHVGKPEDARSTAWAIARRMQARGIFNKGRGLRILETLMVKRMPAIVREEVKREVAAASKGG